MLSGSAASLAACDRSLNQLIGTDAELAGQLASGLAALLDALEASPALTRALANPNRDKASRQTLVRTMLAAMPTRVVDFAAQVVGQRWSQDIELIDAVEYLAFDAALAQAENLGLLEKVEAELFELDIYLVSHRDLRTALGDTTASYKAKERLLETGFGDSLEPQTLYLIKRIVKHPRGRGIRYSLKFLGDLVAARRKRLVAVVYSAQPLSQGQIAKLAATLEDQYGQPMQLNLAVDPATVGGLRVRVGDDVVDGTIVARFKQLKRAVAL
ncbi:MAG: F0F1 ATP synthase subunit delta [Micrococcales bacterium]|nr:F0F1 ATP synthase subunit delta [Micrococcales bacterium]